MAARSHVEPARRRGGNALDHERALAVHRFIHFFDRHIRAPYLQPGGGSSSGAGSRVLLALGSKQELTATQIARELRLDHGYLSRILNSFRDQAIIAGASSKTDRRVHRLRLTMKGWKLVASIQRGRDRRLRTMFGKLSAEDAHAVIAAMRSIETILDRQGKE